MEEPMNTPAIARTADALDRLAAALVADDREQADRAAADAAVWWTVAHAQSATTADVNAHRAA